MSASGMPPKVNICECWARDGIQGEDQFIPTEKKIAIINRMVDVGFKRIEVTSFAHPKLVRQFSDSLEMLKGIQRPADVTFIMACIAEIRRAPPRVKIEVRMENAFFSDAIVSAWDEKAIEFTISLPFERFVELRKQIQGWSRWRILDATWSFFDCGWTPKKWKKTYRFLFIRQRCATIHKERIQLDLFVPYEYGYEYEFKVIVTNKWASGKKTLMYHNGRAAQESVFGELKSQSQMDYIAVRGLLKDQLFMLAAALSHNLNQELQMETKAPNRGTT